MSEPVRATASDDESAEQPSKPELHVPVHPVRFVTATSLFDGHDAAINIMRRILQSQGAEVIHLGHNRSVDEVVTAAIQEDVQGVAVSSYQGGHLEYFGYLVDLLAERGASHIKVYGGGGGVIVPTEIAELQARGVAHIFSPQDGQRMGLPAMVNTMVAACGTDLAAEPPASLDGLFAGDERILARVITVLEAGREPAGWADEIAAAASAAQHHAPVLGITGTGGSGKSSLTDELLRRVRLDTEDKLRVAVLAVDPTRRKGGGALLGDRIRMNAIEGGGTFVRSLATRGADSETPACLPAVIAACRAAGFDLIIVETPGIGQGDSAVVNLADVALYVMTPEFGASSQLEKIDMLDFADVVAINKFDRRGADDALRDVRRQLMRNRELFGVDLDSLPVYGTVAARFNDDGVTALYQELRSHLAEHGLPVPAGGGSLAPVATKVSTADTAIVPPKQVRYLADIADTVRRYHARVDAQAEVARRRQQLDAVLSMVDGRSGGDEGAVGRRVAAGEGSATLRAQNSDTGTREYAQSREGPIGAGATPPASDNGEPPDGAGVSTPSAYGDTGDSPASVKAATAPSVTSPAEPTTAALQALRVQVDAALAADARALLDGWPGTAEAYRRSELVTGTGDHERHTELTRTSLSGSKIPRVALPRYHDYGDLLRWLMAENLPGRFPFTAGVFPFKRENEDPARMFAGEGGPARTNRRFHLLAEGQPATRLSTAFDSVTLYGFDPAERPDIYGKVGNAGVSIATLDDMKVLYGGFDLCDPTTSVSMTINGPAPTMLAFFMNTVIDQRLERFEAEHGRAATGEETAEMRAWALSNVRGTVQADILKEDQGQNTCILSTEFALAMMADIAEWFVEHRVRNFYSVSISGYHIAEAGANPLTQLAFTLANGFTYVEAYLARGMAIDDFAPNLSFFFSNGMDPEYSVLGRVARRIWAVAMRDRYGASERSQKLKYHVQTSGRSLHAQEMSFNDIRTTLQALIALYDNCNSLHTNAYDEAVTTPTSESVRRALAIQLIINREWGLAMNENPLQGSFVIDELTELVERAVLDEFDRPAERGGVLGAMETGYQRGRIQDESMLYEHRKHDGSLPIVGVNTFVNPVGDDPDRGPKELARSSDDEKRDQIARLRAFQTAHAAERPAMLARLREASMAKDNLFEVLMDAVRCCTLGEITHTLFEVGGRYRRNV